MQSSFIFTKDFTHNHSHYSRQFAFWGRQVGIYPRIFLKCFTFWNSGKGKMMSVHVIMEVSSRSLGNRVHNS